MAERDHDRFAYFRIADDDDVVTVRLRAREVGLAQGLDARSVDSLCTALLEIARNILVHADTGDVTIGPIARGGVTGVEIIARDTGPGIPDLDLAFRDGYSTAGSLGLGLASAKRLVDEFAITSAAGAGTIVALRSWAAPASTSWRM